MNRHALLAGLAALAVIFGGAGQAITPGQRLPILFGRKIYVAPVNKALPVISPTSPSVGALETATVGSWTGPPTGYTYQWEWFDTSANIGGATLSTYTPVAGDVGHTLAIKVTASNIKGSATATSAATSAVAAGGCSNSLVFSSACNSQYVGIF